MDDLSALLGQKALAAVVLDFLKKEMVVEIEGPSGCGKTVLGKSVGDTWVKSGAKGAIFYMEGDNANFDRPYYPFNMCLSGEKVLFRKSLPLRRTLSESAKGVPFAGDLVSFVIETLGSRGVELQKNASRFLTTQEQEIIFEMQYIAKGENILIIADNFQWWDDSSIRLLRAMVSDEVKRVFPLFNNLHIVLIITADQESVNQKYFTEFRKQYASKCFKMCRFPQYSMRNILHFFGVRKNIPEDVANVIYSLTGGHLKLIKEIASYIEQCPTTDESELHIFNIPSRQALLEKLLCERLKFYGASGDHISDLLEAASIIGLSFDYHELECLTREKNDRLRSIIRKANELSLVEDSTGRLHFSHEIIREFFVCKVGGKITKYHSCFANCLSLLRPGDYAERANHFFEAGEIEKSITLYIVAYLKSLRDGTTFAPKFLARISEFHENCNLGEYFSAMNAAYEKYMDRQYLDSIEILRGIEDIYSELLVMEKDYLLALNLSKSIVSENIEEGIERLRYWENEFGKTEEGEAWARLLSTLIILHLHLNNFEKAVATERTLMRYFTSRLDFDSSALYGINVIRRKASALHPSDIAVQRTADSLSYFGPSHNSSVPLNPVQYYMALSNHTGNLTVLGEFKEAFAFAQRAINLFNEFPRITFSRREIPVNNYVVSGVLSDQFAPAEGLKIMEAVLNEREEFSDKIILLSNYAVLCALNDDLPLSTDYFQKAVRMLTDASSDEYYWFLIRNNLMTIDLMLGNLVSARNTWKLLEDYVPTILRAEKPFLQKRHELFGKLIRRKTAYRSRNFLLGQYPNELGKAWLFFGRDFILSDLQFWSES